MDEVNEWGIQTKEISTAEIDKAISDYVEAYAKYEEAKNIAKELNEKADALEAQVLDILEKAGKKKYFIEGIGTVSVSNRFSVKTPKDQASKQAFFDYIKSNYDDGTMWSYITVHSQSLNSFYKKEVEALASQGKVAMIPGLEEPTAMPVLSIRKERK